MLPSNALSVSSDGLTTATVSGKSKDLIALIGCSTAYSVIHDKEVNSFSINLPRELGDKGVVAVRMTCGTARAFLINFSLGQDSPVNLKDDWVPIDGRLGQIYPNGVLVVTIDTNTYGTDLKYCDYVVDDPDLLCRYLSGNVDNTAIIATAEKVSQDQSEIAILRDQIADVNSADKVRIIELESSLVHCNKAMTDLLETITSCNNSTVELEQEKRSNKQLKMLLERADRFLVAIGKIAETHSLYSSCSKSMRQIKQRISFYINAA